MIPALVDLDASVPWPVLPPGIHDATLAELAIRFALTPHRRSLLEGFQRCCQSNANRSPQAACRSLSMTA
jgi:hypothetical protein